MKFQLVACCTWTILGLLTQSLSWGQSPSASQEPESVQKVDVAEALPAARSEAERSLPQANPQEAELPPLRDPTVPSPEILQRLPNQQRPTTGVAAVVAPPPKLPALKLKGIVLTGEREGVALLESGANSYRLKLKRDAQRRYGLPLVQTPSIPLGAVSATAKSPVPARKPSISVNDLNVDGVFLSLVDFDADSVLLRSVVSGELILVQ